MTAGADRRTRFQQPNEGKVTEHSHDMQVPKPLLIGAAVLIASVTIFVAGARLTGIGVADLSDEVSVERMQVRFLDEANGAVGAYDPDTNEPLFIYQPGEGGFVRTALRSLSLDRRKAGFGPEAPFELQKSATGNIVLVDPMTRKSITLDAFGDANQSDFAHLFDDRLESKVP
jgi:putative photosynthetic complex assembly protein